MLELLNILHTPAAWLLSLSPVWGYSIMGVLLMLAIGSVGFALARLGYSPLWALLILIPFIPAIALWIIAYKKWPAEKAAHTNAA